jgi:hypothetical protein
MGRVSLPLAALWLLALAAYSNSFHGELVSDNQLVIGTDPRVHAVTLKNLSLIATQPYWYVTGEADLYRPLTTLSLLFNYAVLRSGTNTLTYHMVNFVLHGVSIWLVYLLGIAIFEEARSAWLMAALWAVHPILTESVSNIIGRAGILAGIGILAALLCHIRASRTDGPERLRWLTWLAFAAAVGVFSKESGIAVLGVMAVWDLTIGSSGSWRSRVANYAAAAAPCAIFVAIRMWLVHRGIFAFITFTDNPLVGASFWISRLTAVKILGIVMKLLIWPVTLSEDYSYNQIPLFSGHLVSFEDWKVPLALAVCAVLATMAIAWRRRRPRLAFFIGLFFVTLAPTANIFFIAGTPLAERRR